MMAVHGALSELSFYEMQDSGLATGTSNHHDARSPAPENEARPKGKVRRDHKVQPAFQLMQHMPIVAHLGWHHRSPTQRKRLGAARRRQREPLLSKCLS